MYLLYNYMNERIYQMDREPNEEEAQAFRDGELNIFRFEGGRFERFDGNIWEEIPLEN